MSSSLDAVRDHLVEARLIQKYIEDVKTRASEISTAYEKLSSYNVLPPLRGDAELEMMKIEAIARLAKEEFTEIEKHAREIAALVVQRETLQKLGAKIFTIGNQTFDDIINEHVQNSELRGAELDKLRLQVDEHNQVFLANVAP